MLLLLLLYWYCCNGVVVVLVIVVVVVVVAADKQPINGKAAAWPACAISSVFRGRFVARKSGCERAPIGWQAGMAESISYM